MGNLIFPIDASTYTFEVSSLYGLRVDPHFNYSKFHDGIDIYSQDAQSQHVDILSMQDGVVIF
ncbi:MAG: hypothetical protein HRT90_12185, partial [Candidatus Margulisbacteria bacterium]|nr:hypothetical protein [Candidatus Margulisiibacteriota bacterium]